MTKQSKKQKVHKAKDVDLRDQLNEEDLELRKALEVNTDVRARHPVRLCPWERSDSVQTIR